MKPKPFSARDVTPRIPWLGLMCLTLCLLAIKEWYPFSHFPMYSRLEDKASVVFISGADNGYIPIRTAFGVSASEVKKLYNRERGLLTMKDERAFHDSTESEDRKAGVTVLNYLVNRRRGSFWRKHRPSRIRLYHRVISLAEGGGIEREDRFIAELEVNP